GYLYVFKRDSGERLWRICCSTKQNDPDDWIVAPPIVDRSTAYVSLARDYQGCNGMRIRAIDLTSREFTWAYVGKPNGGIMGPMALVNGVLFAAGYEGLIIAIDARTGKELWSRQFEEANLGGVAIYQNRLYVGNDNRVYALSLTSGRSEREYVFPDGSEVNNTPVMADGKLFVLTHKGFINYL